VIIKKNREFIKGLNKVCLEINNHNKGLASHKFSCQSIIIIQIKGRLFQLVKLLFLVF
jgi:hypothetical protein